MLYCTTECMYSSPPILRGFWDENINRVKPRNWGGSRKTGAT